MFLASLLFVSRPSKRTTESVIYGDLLDRQKDFIEALMRVDNIMVWVVDKHHKVRKVIQTTWDYRPSAKLFNELLEG
jgi:hypothetical protein